jgi:hypothetical protein
MPVTARAASPANLPLGSLIALRVALPLVALYAVAVTTAILDLFRTMWIMGPAILLASLAWYWQTRRLVGQAPRLAARATYAAVFGLVACNLALTVLLHHWTIDHFSDPGVYWSQAIVIAREGGVSSADPWVASYSGYRSFGAGATSQFLPGYPAYLAAFYLFFGTYGMFVADALAVAAGLLLAWSLFENLGEPHRGLAFLALFVSAYTTLWFSRRFGSEQLMFLLFWLAAWLLVRSRRQQDARPAAWGLVVAALLMPVRPEGILFLVSYLVAAAFVLVPMIRRRRAQGVAALGNRKALLRGAVVVLAALLGIGALLVLYQNETHSRYLEDTLVYRAEDVLRRAQGLLGLERDPVPANPNATTPSTDREEARQGLGWYGYLPQQPRFITDLLWIYQIVPLLVLGVAGLAWGRWRFDTWLPLLIGAPFLVFLIQPSVTPDQPWFMRRYWAGLVPLAAYAAAQSLDVRTAARRKIAAALVGLLMACQGVVAMPMAFERAGEGGIEAMQALADDHPGAIFLFATPSMLYDSKNRTRATDYAPVLQFCCDAPTLVSRVTRVDDARSVSRELDLVRLRSLEDFVVVGPLREQSGAKSEIHPLFFDGELELVGLLDFRPPNLPRDANLYDPILRKAPFVGYARIQRALDELPLNQMEPQVYRAGVYTAKPGAGFGRASWYAEGFLAHNASVTAYGQDWRPAGRALQPASTVNISRFSVTGGLVPTELEITYRPYGNQFNHTRLELLGYRAGSDVPERLSFTAEQDPATGTVSLHASLEGTFKLFALRRANLSLVGISFEGPG